jgi:hypothetical protein
VGEEVAQVQSCFPRIERSAHDRIGGVGVVERQPRVEEAVAASVDAQATR